MPTFDTLQLAKRLKDAGVADAMAEGMAEALGAQSEVLVTKTDLHTELNGLRTELTAAIGAGHTEMTAAIGSVRTETTAAIGSVRTELTTKMDALFTRIDDRMAHVTETMQQGFRHNDQRFSSLETQLNQLRTWTYLFLGTLVLTMGGLLYRVWSVPLPTP